MRIARVKSLRNAIDNEVEFLEDNCPNQSSLAIGFDNGRKNRIATTEFEPHILYDWTMLGVIVSVANFCLPGFDKTESVHRRAGNDQMCSTGIHHAFAIKTTNL